MNYFEHFTTEAVKRMSAIYKSNLTNEMKLAHFNELSKKCFDFENQPDANAYLKDGMPGVDKIYNKHQDQELWVEEKME